MLWRDPEVEDALQDGRFRLGRGVLYSPLLRRDTSLSHEQRKLYTQRLLTLYQLIQQAPDHRYNHAVYTETTGSKFGNWIKGLLTSDRHCGTTACAIGHACLHPDKFPGLTIKVFEDEYPVLNPTAKFNYFGPGSFQDIFELGAYGKPADQVTKEDALQRIDDYVTKVLGCNLTE